MTSTKLDGEDETTCNYCGKWWFLCGNTSNAQYHLTNKHPEKLQEQDEKTTPASESGQRLRKPREAACTARSTSPVKQGGKKCSFIWQHMTSTKLDGKDKTKCNYCDKWWFLGGSTSNAQTHLRSKHPEKLPEQDAPTIPASSLPSISSSKLSPKSLKSKHPDKLPEQNAPTTPASSLPSTSSSKQLPKS